MVVAFHIFQEFTRIFLGDLLYSPIVQTSQRLKPQTFPPCQQHDGKQLSRHPKCLSIDATTTTFLVVVMAFFGHASAEWEYQRVARTAHNQLRARHSSRSLYSTKDLNRRAEKCAHYYANLGNIDHSCPYVYNDGENIWANWGGRPTDSGATLRSINSWYAEEKYYKYKGRQSGSGHFTQLVWRDTKAMGFGVARERHMTVAVAIYWPPGNYNGEYTRNVWRPYHRSRYKYG